VDFERVCGQLETKEEEEKERLQEWYDELEKVSGLGLDWVVYLGITDLEL
jgi:hypothetical protein